MDLRVNTGPSAGMSSVFEPSPMVDNTAILKLDTVESISITLIGTAVVAVVGLIPLILVPGTTDVLAIGATQTALSTVLGVWGLLTVRWCRKNAQLKRLLLALETMTAAFAFWNTGAFIAHLVLGILHLCDVENGNQTKLALLLMAAASRYLFIHFSATWTIEAIRSTKTVYDGLRFLESYDPSPPFQASPATPRSISSLDGALLHPNLHESGTRTDSYF